MKDEELDAMLREVKDPPPEGDHVDDRDLVAHRRGELEEAEARRVDRHLATCVDCRELFAELSVDVPAEVRARAQATLTGGQARRGRAWAGWAAAAAAAAVLVAVGTTSTTPRLPDYTWAGPEGGRQVVRAGDPAPSRTFTPDSRFDLTLRPTVPVEDATAHLWLYVGRGDGRVERVGVSAERAPSGALRVRSTARAVLGETPGPRTVHAIVSAEPDAPPQFDDEAALAAFARQRPHLRARVELVAGEDPER